MTARLTGNYGTQRLGIKGEKKTKPKRTPPTNMVLGPLIVQLVDEMAADDGQTRSEFLRTLIVAAARRRGKNVPE